MVSSSAYVITVLAVLLLFQSVDADDLGDLLSPLLSPIFENVCKEVECGKGSCKSSGNSSFSFECECNPGWKRSLLDDDDHFKFLPCIIPNCTLNHSCLKAPPPGQQNKPRTSESIFNPCRWVDCGSGSCNKTSLFAYNCVCFEGYHNLLNFTSFPCYKECSIGMDCQKLGIPVTNQPASTTPRDSAADNASRGVLQHGSLSTISSATCVALLLLLLKY